MNIKHNKEKITRATDIATIMRGILNYDSEADQEKEHFWVIGLNTNNRIIYIELSALGILDEAPVHPRETYRLAIVKGVKSIIVIHNHPSGNKNPSEQDITLTKRLAGAGDILGIRLLDHIIIADDGYCSLREEGKF